MYIIYICLAIFIQVERSLIPLCVGVDSSTDQCDMLTLSDVLAINQALPYKYREKWSLLFDSRCVYVNFKQSLFGSMRQAKKLISATLELSLSYFAGVVSLKQLLQIEKTTTIYSKENLMKLKMIIGTGVITA